MSDVPTVRGMIRAPQVLVVATGRGRAEQLTRLVASLGLGVESVEDLHQAAVLVENNTYQLVLAEIGGAAEGLHRLEEAPGTPPGCGRRPEVVRLAGPGEAAQDGGRRVATDPHSTDGPGLDPAVERRLRRLASARPVDRGGPGSRPSRGRTED